MTNKIVLLIIVLVLLLIIPQILKRATYKKLTNLLGTQQYEKFESTLDSMVATFSFRPFNREYMRLTSYFMQNDSKKIESQLDMMFSKLRLKDEQKSSIAKRGFYFYLEQQNKNKSLEMLKLCESDNEYHNMKLMYDILIEKKSDYIHEIQDKLKQLEKESDAQSNQAKVVRIGVFEYLIGLQYTYLHNKKMSQKYLQSALKHCKNTPYQVQIEALLK